VAAVVAHVDVVGSARAARSRARLWARVEPALDRFASPAEVAAACRAARGAGQDRLLSALLRHAGGDEWAQLTVLAGVADRLAWVVRRWARAGMSPTVLADAEAELVAACWSAIAAWGDERPPDRPGLVLVDRAWETVRVGRRRDRRHGDRHVAWPEEMPAVAAGRSGLELLAGQVSDGFRDGGLGLRAARAVYLTRVSGLSTVEAGQLLGCRPDVVRVLRSRAQHRLTAA
jgi:DNA-directed RNA polymerase specialized sigma24 family protein